MKLKIICLLTVLLIGSLAASPNRCCNGKSCTGKSRLVGTAITPAKAVTLMIDDTELLPIHIYFNNF
jgi:hypothetical protein